jgi:hypothetical protein
MVRSRGALRLRDQVRAVGPLAIGGVAAWVAAREVASALEPNAPLVALVVSVAAGLAAYAAGSSLFEPRLLPGTLAQARGLFRR